jgi:hypothetical protein
MAYINLSSANRSTRAAAINTAIGSSGNMVIYTGTQPINPDLTATGTLIVTLPLSATAAVATTTVQSAVVVSGGSGGTNGTQTVTGATGTGTKFTASVTIAGGAITSVNSITSGGSYTVNPTNLNAETLTGSPTPPTGATLALNMTGLLTFNTIATTPATGAGTNTAGYARITTSGGTGIVDLDCGTSGTSVILNTTSIVNGGPVVVSSCVFTEA